MSSKHRRVVTPLPPPPSSAAVSTNNASTSSRNVAFPSSRHQSPSRRHQLAPQPHLSAPRQVRFRGFASLVPHPQVQNWDYPRSWKSDLSIRTTYHPSATRLTRLPRQKDLRPISRHLQIVVDHLGEPFRIQIFRRHLTWRKILVECSVLASGRMHGRSRTMSAE